MGIRCEKVLYSRKGGNWCLSGLCVFIFVRREYRFLLHGLVIYNLARDKSKNRRFSITLVQYNYTNCNYSIYCCCHIINYDYRDLQVEYYQIL